MECKWQVENNEWCQRVLAKHWPDVRRYNDVCTFPPADADRNCIRNESRRGDGACRETATQLADIGDEWAVDVICGGFPCQDISPVGKRAGIHGPQSGLWFEFARVVRSVRPRYVVVENSAALVNCGLDAVLGELATSGYDAEWDVLAASDFNAPHIRERTFVLLFRDTEGVGRREGRTGRSHSADSRQQEPSLCNSDGVRCEGIFSRNEQGRPRFAERCDWWSAEPDVVRVVHGVSGRVDRIRGLGNAVIPQVAEWIGRRILSHAGVDG